MVGKPSCKKVPARKRLDAYSLEFGVTVTTCKQDTFDASPPSQQEREEALMEDLGQKKTLVEIELDDDATLDGHQGSPIEVLGVFDVRRRDNSPQC